MTCTLPCIDLRKWRHQNQPQIHNIQKHENHVSNQPRLPFFQIFSVEISCCQRPLTSPGLEEVKVKVQLGIPRQACLPSHSQRQPVFDITVSWDRNNTWKNIPPKNEHIFLWHLLICVVRGDRARLHGARLATRDIKKDLFEGYHLQKALKTSWKNLRELEWNKNSADFWHSFHSNYY